MNSGISSKLSVSRATFDRIKNQPNGNIAKFIRIKIDKWNIFLLTDTK